MPLPPPLTSLAWPQGWPAMKPPPALDQLPRLTVVTPSYNQGQYLEATLRSVLEQSYPNLEYLVIDGGSRDDSRRILEHYSGHLAYWVSEKDQGQAHAIQKGLERASGDWFVWINSDDLLAPGALWAIAAAAQDADLIAGTTQYFSDHGLLGTRPSRKFSARNFVLEQLGSGMKWHQPSVWFRREFLHQIGLNRGLHYSFDHELMIRYLHRFSRVHYLDDVLAWFRYHETSKTVSQAAHFRAEQVLSFRCLADEVEFSDLRDDLKLAARAVEWLQEVDRRLDDRSQSRWRRFAELILDINDDRAARCTANTRRAALRILKYGGRKGA